MYFIKRDKEGSKLDSVLSLCKLKTLEYRMFRKIREKCRNYSGASNTDTVIQRFIREAKELSRGHKLPHPLDFYIDIMT